MNPKTLSSLIMCTLSIITKYHPLKIISFMFFLCRYCRQSILEKTACLEFFLLCFQHLTLEVWQAAISSPIEDIVIDWHIYKYLMSVQIHTKYLCATAHSLTKYCYNQSCTREILYIQANLTPKKSQITYNINKGMVISE